MPFYETMVVTRGSKFILDMVPSIKKWSYKIVENGGIIRALDPIGNRPIPHMMSRFKQREREGYFIRFRMDCNPESLKEFEDIMRNDFDVLRFMTRRITNKDVLLEYLYYYPESPFSNPESLAEEVPKSPDFIREQSEQH